MVTWFLWLVWLRSTSGSHVTGMCREVTVASPDASSTCGDNEVIQGLMLAPSDCTSGCVDDIDSMRCCELDSSPEIEAANFDFEFSFDNGGQFYGCTSSGFFLQGFAMASETPLTLSSLKDAKCARLPRSFSSALRNTYSDLVEVSFQWNQTRSEAQWTVCPDGYFMTSLMANDAVGNPQNAWDLQTVKCALPNDRECGALEAGPTLRVSAPCSHQGCELTQTCAPGYSSPDSPQTFVCRNSGDWEGTQLTCQDVNECAVDNPCHAAPVGVCENTPGSFECSCVAGYTLVGGLCEDNDECARECTADEDPLTELCHDCDAFTESCNNTRGGFVCPCSSGFQRQDVNATCENIIECAMNPCPGFSECVDTIGSFRCDCPVEGYGTGECSNNNECDRQCEPGELPLIDNCHDCNAQDGLGCIDLTNATTGYQCDCRLGYDKIGSDCVNINECVTLTDPCPSESDCHDTEGAYLCSPYISRVELGGSLLATLDDNDNQLEVTVVYPSETPACVLQEASLGFGSAELPLTFACSVSLTSDPLVCQTQGRGAGQNLAMAFSYCLDAELTVCFTKRDDQLFSFSAPSIDIDSLRTDKNTYPSSSSGVGTLLVLDNTIGGEVIWVDGNNFFTGGSGDEFRVTVGPDAYECDLVLGSVTKTSLACRLPSISGQTMQFRVTSGSGTSQQSVVSSDMLTLTENVPELVSVSGCPGPNVAGPRGTTGTSDCPTLGGTMLTLIANNVVVADLLVLVGDSACIVDPGSFGSGGAAGDSSFRCTLPAGVGLFRPVLLGHQPDRVLSTAFNLVSYSPPSIDALVPEHPCVQNSSLALFACPRTGGVKLSIKGFNFGFGGALVSIGGHTVATTHVYSFAGGDVAQGRHGHLVVDLPPIPANSRGAMPILIKQHNGLESTTLAVLNYADCSTGSMADGPVCTPCPAGSYAPGDGFLSCRLCPPGSFQDKQGQVDCKLCAPRSMQSSPGMSACNPCPPGTRGNTTGATACASCPGGRYSPSSSSECLPCSEGKHQPAERMGECLPCLAGSFSTAPGAVECVPCPTGRFSSTNGSLSCDLCPRGKYADTQGGSKCAECEAGTFTNEKNTVRCALCTPGRYHDPTNPNATSRACLMCDPGRYQATEGQASCNLCPLGSFADRASAVACDLCPAGRFSRSDGVSCTLCPIGTYQDNPGKGECVACAAGRSNSVPGARACPPCFQGTFQAFNSSRSCALCPSGRIAVGQASTTCQACEPGRSVSAEGQSVCLSCTAGKYAEQWNSTDCLDCPAGSFQTAVGSSSCKLCAPGYFSATGARTCTPCPAGSYAALHGESACGLCPRRISEPNDEGSKCLCEAGRFASTREVDGRLDYQCPICPIGSVCNTIGVEADDLLTRPGWWRSSNRSLTFYRCLISSVCPGGSTDGESGSSPCAPHRVGPVCGVCEANYKQAGSSSTCVKCPENSGESWGLSALVVIAVLVFLALMYAVVLYVTNRQQQGLVDANKAQEQLQVQHVRELLDDMQGDGAIEVEEEEITLADDDDAEDQSETARRRRRRALQAKQLNSTTTSTGDIAFASSVSSLRSTQQAKPLSVRQSPNFMYKTKIMVGFFQVATIISFQGDVSWPKYFGAFISIFNVFNFDFLPWQTLGCATNITFFGKALIAGLLPLIVLLLLTCFYYIPVLFWDQRRMDVQLSLEQRRAGSKRQFVRLLLLTVFLLYPYVSRMVLSVYNCSNIDGELFLIADFSLHCGTPLWSSYAGGMAIFILLYPIGIPLVYFMILRSHRADFRDPGVILQFGFLFEPYTDNRWFWELLDMGHKLLLTSVVSFAPSDAQLVFHMVVLVLYTGSLLLFAPYIRKGDDRLHLFAQAQLILLAMVGWVLQNTQDGALAEDMDILVSVLLIFMTTFFMGTFLLLASRNAIKAFRLRKAGPVHRKSVLDLELQQ